MKHTILSLCIICLSFLGQTQLPHDNPEHPKGFSQDQYLALPYYNEACELFANGHIEKAKASLYEAIETSFALTEAHLFLADIYREQGQLDSAFYFYNSGIDFAIEQKPHYYFYLMETGVELGQYFIMNHNLKNFKKKYGKLGEEPYEENYPYTRDDYEFWEKTLAFVYDYENWINKARFSYAIPIETSSISVSDDLYLMNKDGAQRMKGSGTKMKAKAIKGIPADATDLFVSNDQKIAIYALEDKGSIKLFIAQGNGKKFFSGKALDSNVNRSTLQEAPFLVHDKSRLYFTSNENGNKDIFVAVLDTNDFSVLSVAPLDRINTLKDETSFTMNEDNKTCYFASNGLVGFGGFDIYYCENFEIANGTLFPFNARNVGASFNSNFNELKLLDYNGDFLLVKEAKGRFSCEVLTPIPQDTFYYEIDSFKNIYKENEKDEQSR